MRALLFLLAIILSAGCFCEYLRNSCSFKIWVRFVFGFCSGSQGPGEPASRRKGKARVTVWHRATIQRKLVRGAVEVTLRDESIFAMSKPALFRGGLFQFQTIYPAFCTEAGKHRNGDRISMREGTTMNRPLSMMSGILMLLTLITVPVTALAAIDTAPPTTTSTPTGTKGSDGWYTTAVTVTLVATDGLDGSGVAKTEYSLDNVTWQTYSAPFSVDKDGKQFVYFRSTDNAGNLESPAKSQEIKINKTGLVGWWKMDGDWKDASVVGNNGTPFNAATFSPNAKVGTQAGSFNGVNDYVAILHNDSLNPSSSQTIAFWIYFSSFPNAYKDIIQKGIGSAKTQYYIRTNAAGGMDFWLRNTGHDYAFSSEIGRAHV